MADLSEARRQMVAHQIQERGVRSPAVARAMREVPREEFMGEDMREFAYADSPLPIGEGQTISQPYIVAYMTEALELEGGERVLEGVASMLFPLHNEKDLLVPRLERAIGVIYRPQTELASHYFQAVLPKQFDEYCWFDRTSAVQPLDTKRLKGMPETYPFGL